MKAISDKDSLKNTIFFIGIAFSLFFFFESRYAPSKTLVRGGFLGSASRLAAVSSPDLRDLLIAVGGSVVMLTAYRVVRGSLN